MKALGRARYGFNLVLSDFRFIFSTLGRYRGLGILVLSTAIDLGPRKRHMARFRLNFLRVREKSQANRDRDSCFWAPAQVSPFVLHQLGHPFY